MLSAISVTKKACLNGKQCIFRGLRIRRYLPNSGVRAECRQGAQRLWKRLHRDDAEPVRVLPRNPVIVPSRDEEGVHTSFACADRFLLDTADRPDRAVGADLTGRRDLVAVDD